jgi:predicted O-methyltransferase YrrM
MFRLAHSPANHLQLLLRSVEGWLTAREAEFLYLQARACPREAAIVEIGSFKGRSTICLAKGAEAGDGARVFAVDPHDGGTYPVFLRNLEAANVLARVSPIVKTSVEFNPGWAEPIGLLFIDGDHKYASVEQDFLLWSPYVIDGGVIAFHDTTSSPRDQLMGYLGPKRVVDRYLFASAGMKSIGFVGTTTFVTKGKACGWRRDLAFAWVRFRKLFPDSLLYLHHHVISRLPAGALGGLRRALYGKKQRGIVEPAIVTYLWEGMDAFSKVCAIV